MRFNGKIHKIPSYNYVSLNYIKECEYNKDDVTYSNYLFLNDINFKCIFVKDFDELEFDTFDFNMYMDKLGLRFPIYIILSDHILKNNKLLYEFTLKECDKDDCLKYNYSLNVYGTGADETMEIDKQSHNIGIMFRQYLETNPKKLYLYLIG